MLQLKHIATDGVELQEVISLFKEYANELNENLCFQSFDEELINPLLKYGQPKGSLFIAKYNDEIVGCVAMQDITNKPSSHQQGLSNNVDVGAVCEMKRLYVKPKFRKNRVGEALVKAIVDSAKLLNYQKMKLDTLVRLKPAIALYQKHGFVITNAYYDNPLPNVVYMELIL